MGKKKNEVPSPVRGEEQEEGGNQYEVRLKPGHPTGTYHRAGLTFSAAAPTLLDGEVPAAIVADAWLLVRALTKGEG